MFDQLWEGLTEEMIGERWPVQELSAAFIFWLGGALAWAWHEYGYWAQGWQQLVDAVKAIDNPAIYLALAMVALVLLTASSLVARWLQLPVLRLLEGYWPRPFRWLRFGLARWRAKRQQKKEDRWQALADIPAEKRNAAQQSEYARLDAELARVPVDPRHLMPTTLGDILRAAEDYPQVRYGLATSVCWPRLWLLLPTETQSELSGARLQLNSAARFFLWGSLFAAWTPWAWWALPVALIAVASAYWAACQAAGIYADLIRSAFDLYRFKLYAAVRLPAPRTPEEEQQCGQQLSVYLFRGVTEQDVRFVEESHEFT